MVAGNGGLPPAAAPLARGAWAKPLAKAAFGAPPEAPPAARALAYSTPQRPAFTWPGLGTAAERALPRPDPLPGAWAQQVCFPVVVQTHSFEVGHVS